jgi:hypothetical protein
MRSTSLTPSIRVVALAATLIATPPLARAAILQAGDAVAGHPGLTYLDLVRRLVPDLALNPATHQIEGHLKTSPRPVSGGEPDSETPDPVVLGFIEDQRIEVGGRKRIAVLADLGTIPDEVAGVSVLMLFDDAPEPRLLDVASVAVDKDTAFADHAQLPLGPGDAALISYSEHDDADLTFGHYLLITAFGDRLRLVREIDTDSERACGWSNVEETTFSTKVDPGSPYRQIEVAVSSVFKHPPGDCGSSPIPRGRSAVYRATFQWNAAAKRFETGSDGLKRLDALNKRVFQ